VDSDQLTDIIFEAIARLNTERGPQDQIPMALDTELFGETSMVDSLGLISILSDVEMGCAEHGYDILLADDNAVAKSPWATVESLRDYVLERLA
jgi:acyl carrier protein